MADDRDGGRDHPIDGTPLLKAGALASVPVSQLPELLVRVQADLGPRLPDYRRRYERIDATADRETFLVEPEHWNEVGDRLGLSDRERDAVARAHEAAVERIGSATHRRDEFETALEIRSGVVIGASPDHAGRSAEEAVGNELGTGETDDPNADR